jgi:hypothetical protein
MVTKIIYLIFGILCAALIPLGLLGIGIYFADRQEKNK